MKRKFFRASWMLALAGMVAFTFVGTSCGDDDDDPAPAPTPNNNDKPNNGGENGGNGGNGNGGGETNTDENKYIVVHTQDLEKHTWDSQFWFKSSIPFATGDEWEISLMVKAEKKVEATYTGDDGKETTVTSLSTQVHNGAGHYMHWAAVGNVPFDTEWKEYKNKGIFSAEMNGGNMICFNLNDYHEANTYYFDQISFKINGVEVVKNGFLETDDYSAFFVKEHQPADDGVDVFIDDPITADNIETGEKEDWWKEAPAVEENPTPKPAGPEAAGKCLVVKSDDMVEQTYETQMWFKSPVKFKEGDEWKVVMVVKAEKKVEATYTRKKTVDGQQTDEDEEYTVNAIGTQTHKDNPGGYIHWSGIGSVPFDTEWKVYKNMGKFTKEQVDGDLIAFNLNDFHEANTYYFDEISFEINGENVIVNGNFEGDDFSSFIINEGVDGTSVAPTAENIVEVK